MRRNIKDPTIFTPEQFKYWLFKVGFGEEHAAEFLNVTTETIRQYMDGRYFLTADQSAQCRQLSHRYL